jgi:transposase
VRETLACSCGQYIVTAPGPDHSVENTRYGDGLRAYIVTSKCGTGKVVHRERLGGLLGFYHREAA